MTAPLTPALALAYLHELSVDVRAAVVLDAAGDPLAGDASLAEPARAALEMAATPVATAGSLLVAGTPDGGAIALIAGDFALLPLLEDDLRATAAVLVTALSDPPGSRESQS